MSQRAPTIAWTKDEIERMIGWMEDHPLEIRGKQSSWHKDIKDEVFKDNAHVTVRRICDKATNMKKQWGGATAARNATGWGVGKSENSITESLEKRCPFFFRLDAIWGTRPNVRIATGLDSTSMLPPPRPKSALPIRDASIPPTQIDSALAAHSDPVPRLPELGSPPVESSPSPFMDYDDMEDVDDSESSLVPSESISQFRSTTPRNQMPSNAPASQSGARSRRSSSQYPLPKREKKNVVDSIKELMESQKEREEQHSAKKLKLKHEVEMEKIKSSERIAQIQAEAQIKQMEVMASMMQQVIQGLRSAHPPQTDNPNKTLHHVIHSYQLS